jgi:hypothetical protein
LSYGDPESQARVVEASRPPPKIHNLADRYQEPFVTRVRPTSTLSSHPYFYLPSTIQRDWFTGGNRTSVPLLQVPMTHARRRFNKQVTAGTNVANRGRFSGGVTACGSWECYRDRWKCRGDYARALASSSIRRFYLVGIPVSNLTLLEGGE